MENARLFADVAHTHATNWAWYRQHISRQSLRWVLGISTASGEHMLDYATRRALFREVRQHIAYHQSQPSNLAPAQGTFGTTDGRHFVWVSTPLRQHGHISGYVATVRDVSAQVSLDQVQDSGPGVPLLMREYIFDKYRQAHVVEARRGTGLGLTFCRLVVEAHDGEIGINDAAGGGSVFWMRLPIAHAAAR